MSLNVTFAPIRQDLQVMTLHNTYIQSLASDKKELEVVETYLKESKISSSATFIEYEHWRSSPWNKSAESEQIHLVLNRDIVTWGQKGLDDVSEVLTCLLILFSQEPGGQFSMKIGHLHDCWRSIESNQGRNSDQYVCFRLILWRYLDCQDLLQETKDELFMGALSMVGITKQIWGIDQNSID